MRVCESCGRENVDRNKFCVWCGHTFLKDEPEEETAAQEAAPFEEVVTAEENLPAEEPEEEKAEDLQAKYPMKWHKFVMVLLIISAILSIADGIAVLSGAYIQSYRVSAERLYSYYPGLKTLTWAGGVISIALGVFRFTVRKRLKNFMENGPRSLYSLYVISIVVAVLTLLIGSAIIKTPITNYSKDWTKTALTACGLFLQKKYYDKRSELFVN